MTASTTDRRRLVLGGAAAAVIVVGVALLVWRPWTSDESSEDKAAPATTSASSAGETAESSEPADVPDRELIVTTTDDAGEGSLREAMIAANSADGTTSIRFDSESGVFDDPQIIELDSPLPEVTGELVVDGYIEDRLFAATGVTVSGAGRFRVLAVAEGATLTVRSLTIADGAADEGAGILNDGALVVDSVSIIGNEAAGSGGGVANRSGAVTVVNSTFVGNGAGRGGGFANLGERATITNSTFSENSADEGGALFSEADVEMSNTILANSTAGGDCVSVGSFDDASTNNLIESNDGCGTPLLTDDPDLEPLNYYNGPTKTLPLRSGSPAINLGDNNAAVDSNGAPLKWDQRGNGDPRFVAGFADIGAFEHQAFPDLVVDTLDDVGLRACTAAGASDCTLRAAIELANATPEVGTITFDTGIFADATTIRLETDLPDVTADLTIDASMVATVSIEGGTLNAAQGVVLELTNVETAG